MSSGRNLSASTFCVYREEMSYKADSKDSKYSDESVISDEKAIRAEAKDSKVEDVFIKVDILAIDIKPASIVDISAPLSITISFNIYKDISDVCWIFKFLVDSCDKRIIRVRSKTSLYPMISYHGIVYTIDDLISHNSLLIQV